MNSNSVAILPTDEMINPFTALADSQYLSTGEVGYILSKPERTRPTRVVSSYGDLGSTFAVGTTHEFRHDQTDGLLGYYTVVGIIDYDTRQTQGEVPNRKLAHAVFK